MPTKAMFQSMPRVVIVLVGCWMEIRKFKLAMAAMFFIFLIAAHLDIGLEQ